jgi:hypothetical protein
VVLQGNVIPQNLINPIGQYIVNQFAKPTASGAYNGSTPNYSGSDDFKTRGDEYVGKLDHQFTPWWSASASYVHLATQEPGGDLFHTFAANDGVLTRYIDATAFNNVFTLNPTTLLTAGYGYSRNTAMDSTRQPGLEVPGSRWVTLTNYSRRLFQPSHFPE